MNHTKPIQAYPQPIEFEDLKVGMKVRASLQGGDVSHARIGRINRIIGEWVYSPGGHSIGSSRYTWELLEPLDPDADLIDAMTRALSQGQESPAGWRWREDMREVLAIVRKHDRVVNQ